MQSVHTHPVAAGFMGLETTFSKDIEAHVKTVYMTRCENFYVMN